MAVENIFIAGMEKSGTTALAQWMVESGLAQDRVPGVKEPYLYADDLPHPGKAPRPGLPLLDASAGYAANGAVIARLPEQDTRIVVCLRNQLERTWSSYKMKKLMTATGSDAAQQYFSSFRRNLPGGGIRPATARPDRETVRILNKFFPRRSHHIIERYALQEMEHLRTHDFATRIEYELAFFLSRRTLPLVSILGASFYFLPLRQLLEKYQPSDVSVITVERLADAGERRRFVEGVFEKEADTPEVPFKFSSAEVAFDEPKPDFSDKSFDMLRACLRYDLAQARELIAKTRFGDSLLDNAALDRHLEV